MNNELLENNKRKKQGEIKIYVITAVIIALLLAVSLYVVFSTPQNNSDDDNAGIINIYADDTKSFDVFVAEYKSDAGETIIKSANGDPAIVPGTDHSYTFKIKNADKVAINYTLNPNVNFIGADKLSLEVRMIAPNGEYLIGGSKEWGSFEDLATLEYESSLSKGESDSFEIQWRWSFENGEDEGDTALGDAYNGSVGIDVKIDIFSEMDTSKDANGGFFDFFK